MISRPPLALLLLALPLGVMGHPPSNLMIINSVNKSGLVPGGSDQIAVITDDTIEPVSGKRRSFRLPILRIIRSRPLATDSRQLPPTLRFVTEVELETRTYLEEAISEGRDLRLMFYQDGGGGPDPKYPTHETGWFDESVLITPPAPAPDSKATEAHRSREPLGDSRLPP